MCGGLVIKVRQDIAEKFGSQVDVFKGKKVMWSSGKCFLVVFKTFLHTPSSD